MPARPRRGRRGRRLPGHLPPPGPVGPPPDQAWLAGRVAARCRRPDRPRCPTGRGPAAETGMVCRASPVASDEMSWREVREVFDTEIAALPECDRLPVVLCCVQELSYEEAARRVGCPVGTLRNRLDRGKERLRKRLARYGLPLAAPALVLCSAAGLRRVGRGHDGRGAVRRGWHDPADPCRLTWLVWETAQRFSSSRPRLPSSWLALSWLRAVGRRENRQLLSRTGLEPHSPPRPMHRLRSTRSATRSRRGPSPDLGRPGSITATTSHV